MSKQSQKPKLKYKILTMILFFVLIALSFSLYNYFKSRCRKADYAVCDLTINRNPLKIKIAYSGKAKEKGLMGVKKLPENNGMIFIYDRERYLSFWMKNTLIPLSIAYIDSNCKIIDIMGMFPQPGTPDDKLATYPSLKPAQYAIEMPLGWFSMRGIKKGDKVEGLKEIMSE